MHFLKDHAECDFLKLINLKEYISINIKIKYKH